MNVALLWDDVDARADATPDERGVLPAVDAVEHALRELGHRPARVPVGTDLGAWLERLRAARPDLAFNLCEGVGGESAHEPRVAALLELIGLPFTGAGSETLALARRKDRVNALLRAEGLPVPGWTTWSPGDDLDWTGGWPAIVKPAGEDGSVGIWQSSVVRDDVALERALRGAADYAPLLVQAFAGTREIAAAFVGARALPLSEIDFSGLPAGAQPIVSYDAKWSVGSAEDAGTRPVCPARLDAATARRIGALAREAWAAVGGRGYGRVDLRLEPTGDVAIIEVNPNPDIAPDAGLPRMAAAAGLDYTALVRAVLEEAA